MAVRPREPRQDINRRHLLALAASSGSALVGIGRPALAGRIVGPEPLKIQPLGPMPGGALDSLERALAAFFGFRIERLPADSMPAAAYYLPRKRYRAELILEALSHQTPTRILGVTALDISTTKDAHADWGILGLGAIGGRSCVVSSFRCKMRASDPRLPVVRLAKVAVHEVAHTLGLQHCPRIGCLMEDANGSVLTCDRETDLCRSCRDQLAGLGFTVGPAPRWSGARSAGPG